MLTFLITAGPTVEDLDPVRFLSNRSSGKLGFAIAAAALRAGHRAILVHGPVDEARLLDLPRGGAGRLKRIPVRSAAQMLRAVLSELPRAEVVLMSAAVADYRPLRASLTKLKKSRSSRVLHMAPTVDILQKLGRIKAQRRSPLVLIGFALETGSLLARRAEARRKLRAKNLDVIVLDSPAAMGASGGNFELLFPDGRIEALRVSKPVLARQLIRLGRSIYSQRMNRTD